MSERDVWVKLTLRERVDCSEENIDNTIDDILMYGINAYHALIGHSVTSHATFHPTIQPSSVSILDAVNSLENFFKDSGSVDLCTQQVSLDRLELIKKCILSSC